MLELLKFICFTLLVNRSIAMIVGKAPFSFIHLHAQTDDMNQYIMSILLLLSHLSNFCTWPILCFKIMT